MANVKISNLTAATTPVAGTEVLPIVQSGATVKVSIANLTPGLSTITTAKGGTGLTSFTSGGVVYASSTSALTTGSALVFDGSNLGVGNAPYVWLSSFRSLDIGSTASFAYFNSGSYVYNNAYYNTSSNLVYKTTGYAQSYIQNIAGQHVWQIAASGTAGNAISFTQAMTLNANGVLALQGASTSANGVGITFPATQSASTDANTLDDYEEGTWTPTQGANLTIVGTFSSSGTYTKIGRFVVARASLTGSVSVAFTGGSAATLCGGLPFSSAAPALGNAVDNNANQGIVCFSTSTNVLGSSAITATGSISLSALYFV